MHDADAQLAKKRDELQQLTEKGVKDREEQRLKLNELNRKIADVQDNIRQCEGQLSDLTGKTEEVVQVNLSS